LLRLLSSLPALTLVAVGAAALSPVIVFVAVMLLIGVSIIWLVDRRVSRKLPDEMSGDLSDRRPIPMRRQ
ncbi:MAG: hypothetical protein AB7E70_21625, partial [Hyphomicrobiaceae bacterium]